MRLLPARVRAPSHPRRLVAFKLVGGFTMLAAVAIAPLPALLGIVAALLFAAARGREAQLRARDLPPAGAEADRYALLAGNMTDVVTVHGRNGQVVSASPAAEPVLGVKPRELSGNGLFERVHVVDRPAYLTALNDVAALRESRVVELRLRRNSTEPGAPAGFAWVEMRCWPRDEVLNAGGDGGLVAVLRDITARKDEEHAVAGARAEAERANVAKSRFIATMSHELRTPLNAIIGFSEMLREEATLMIDAKQRHDYAHLINESGHHLLSVVNGLLDMSKIESGNFELMPEPVDIDKVVAECCELLALRARQAGIEIARDLGVDLPRIIADKRALLQIMLNLLSNAIKFTDRGGKVTVVAAVEPSRDLDQDAEIAQVIITVEDTGVGIGAQDLDRVGEPFFQARSAYDRRHDGTGLGVSIVKGLLALHGGGMEIESHVGKGTRIRVRLPIDCESACHRREEVLARVVPHARGARLDLRSEDLRSQDLRLELAPDQPSGQTGETVASKMVRKSA